MKEKKQDGFHRRCQTAQRDHVVKLRNSPEGDVLRASTQNKPGCLGFFLAENLQPSEK